MHVYIHMVNYAEEGYMEMLRKYEHVDDEGYIKMKPCDSPLVANK